MPRLTINLDKITANARLVAGMLEPLGIGLVGVTKACLGNWHVGGAMLAGGAAALADSRGASIARLRRHLPGTGLQLLRSQPSAEPDGAAADLYFVSSAAQATAVMRSDVATMRFCLMVETGDGREGIIPAHAAAEAVRLAAVPGAVLAGVATNTACTGDALSLSATLDAFHGAAEGVLQVIDSTRRIAGAGIQAQESVISAGGSGLLGLLLEDRGDEWLKQNFGWLTQLRCGEALLLGNVPRGGDAALPLPGAHTDAFLIEAPVLEAARKDGGNQFLLGLGIQDIGAGIVTPVDPELVATRATSDYLALTSDQPAASLPAVGDRLALIPSYYALLAAMTSPFVEKELTGAASLADYPLPLFSVSDDSVWDS